DPMPRARQACRAAIARSRFPWGVTLPAAAGAVDGTLAPPARVLVQRRVARLPAAFGGHPARDEAVEAALRLRVGIAEAHRDAREDAPAGLLDPHHLRLEVDHLGAEAQPQPQPLAHAERAVREQEGAAPAPVADHPATNTL